MHVPVCEITTDVMRKEGCDKSASVIVTGTHILHVATHSLCIQSWESITSSALIEMSATRDVSVTGRVQGPHPGLVCLLFKAQVAYTGGNVWGCQKPLPAQSLVQLVPGHLFAREKAAQKQQQQLCGVSGQVRGRSSNQLSAWGLCDTADFTAARLWGDTKLD